MALTRRSGARLTGNIWPGFVDAMTALLLILMFVLSIFMIVQFVLRDQVDIKDQELNVLGGQLQQLATALGLEQQRSDQLETDLSGANSDLADAEAQAAQQAALIATLTDQRDTQAGQIASFEDQVAGLVAQNVDLSGTLAATETALNDAERALSSSETALAELQGANDRQISANAALELALAQARSEVDGATEAARLAAARREALEALVADLEAQNAAAAQNATELSETLTETEAARLVEAAAAQALRDRLAGSDAELTAMTLSLEAERQRAEDTLALLAAARTAEAERTQALTAERDAASEREALLAVAREQLADQQQISTESQRQAELLSRQTAALDQQLRELQGVLDEAKAAEAAAQVEIQSLGSDLNTALARVASEQRKVAEEQRRLAEEQQRRADLEEAERKRLEEEAKDLANYRSEFFGRVRDILGDRQGIQVVGDRFVFSSEVLFSAGSATLGGQGRAQLADVASVIREIQGEIPTEINWILRVDGHTDNIPISGGAFSDNWELSQARALSVVRYLITAEDLPSDRLSANGFGEFQPIDPADTAEARARNRRIELKFTER